MKRTAVVSSNIRTIGYDPINKVLEIEFHTGTVYQYSGVPESVYLDLMQAPSKGSYFNDHIKNRYHFKNVK